MATLLIVDDEPRVLSALRRALRREGWDIVTAEGATEALRVLEGRPVDAVLSDYRMPGRNGLELLSEVARRWPRTARYLISGWAGTTSPAELEAAGVRQLIPKPWDVEELRATLKAGLLEVTSG